MKKKFRIRYRDPETGELVVVEKEFDDSPEFPAEMWADDYGYMKADKGYYNVREVSVPKQGGG